MNRKLDPPTENVGLAAIGTSDRWVVSLDESLDCERWWLEIEGPGVYLHFQIHDPTVVSKALRYLQVGMAVDRTKDRKNEDTERELRLGHLGSAVVALQWDDEHGPRCFLIICSEGLSALRLSFGTEDIRRLCEARAEIVTEMPEAGSE
jgi:hypothetical protein